MEKEGAARAVVEAAVEKMKMESASNAVARGEYGGLHGEGSRVREGRTVTGGSGGVACTRVAAAAAAASAAARGARGEGGHFDG